MTLITSKQLKCYNDGSLILAAKVVSHPVARVISPRAAANSEMTFHALHTLWPQYILAILAF